jgi:hypothetical protein
MEWDVEDHAIVRTLFGGRPTLGRPPKNAPAQGPRWGSREAPATMATHPVPPSGATASEQTFPAPPGRSAPQ